MKKFVVLAAWAVMAPAVWSATQTITLSVPDMNCAACPLTVKKALMKVIGVGKTVVDMDRREAKVTFDDAKTNVETLVRATKDAGYPSIVVDAAK